MLDYPLLTALAAVHRSGSFELAAAEIGVTASAISQRIKALEERMGCVLVRRGQPCTATPPGLRLVRHVAEVALLEQALTADLPGPAAAMASLRIAVSADSLACWVIEALAATQGLLFDLVIDDQDHSQDWLRRGEVSAAVTGHSGPVQGCDSRSLGALRYLATASPAFVAQWLPDGPIPEALFKTPAITFNEKDRLQRDWLTLVTGQRRPFPSHRMASSHAFVDAARAGLGWGMNPEPLVRADIAAGRLVALVPDAPMDVPLFWQTSRLAAPALAPLTRAMRAVASRVLLPPNEKTAP